MATGGRGTKEEAGYGYRKDEAGSGRTKSYG